MYFGIILVMAMWMDDEHNVVGVDTLRIISCRSANVNLVGNMFDARPYSYRVASAKTAFISIFARIDVEFYTVSDFRRFRCHLAGHRTW